MSRYRLIPLDAGKVGYETNDLVMRTKLNETFPKEKVGYMIIAVKDYPSPVDDWQAQQLLLCEEKEPTIGEMAYDTYSKRIFLMDEPNSGNAAELCIKILASHIPIDGVLPLGMDTVRAFVDNPEGEVSVEFETLGPNMWQCGCDKYNEPRSKVCRLCGTDRETAEKYKHSQDCRVTVSIKGKEVANNEQPDWYNRANNVVQDYFDKNSEKDYKDITPAISDTYVKIGMSRISEVLDIMKHDALKYSTGEYPDKEWIAEFINGGYCRGVIVDGVLKSALVAEPVVQNGVYLWLVAVNKNDIGKGYGQTLLTHFEQEMTGLNKNWIHLTTGELSENFYRRNGFEATGAKVIEMTKYLNLNKHIDTPNPTCSDNMEDGRPSRAKTIADKLYPNWYSDFEDDIRHNAYIKGYTDATSYKDTTGHKSGDVEQMAKDYAESKVDSDFADIVRELMVKDVAIHFTAGYNSTPAKYTADDMVKDSGWIDIKDKLPENKTPVQVVYKSGQQNVGTCEDVESKPYWREAYNLNPSSTPTHWKPLDAPPLNS